jgi:Mrp family chromosome partitioning ATPase
MISGSPGLSRALSEALSLLIEPPAEEMQGFRRAPNEHLTPPLFDLDFTERCRIALGRLVATEDEGVIAVCSARRGEGRSTVAAAVAASLSQSRTDTRVLLLDLDFGHPTQAQLLSVPPAPGLADFVEGRERLRLVGGTESS